MREQFHAPSRAAKYLQRLLTASTPLAAGFDPREDPNARSRCAEPSRITWPSRSFHRPPAACPLYSILHCFESSGNCWLRLEVRRCDQLRGLFEIIALGTQSPAKARRASSCRAAERHAGAQRREPHGVAAEVGCAGGDGRQGARGRQMPGRARVLPATRRRPGAQLLPHARGPRERLALQAHGVAGLSGPQPRGCAGGQAHRGRDEVPGISTCSGASTS